VTTTGKTQIAKRSALVESFASTATLQATMMVAAANHPPRSHVRDIVFNMIATPQSGLSRKEKSGQTLSKCASDQWPKWACRRAPARGALLERWRAQCGLTGSTIHDSAIPLIGTGSVLWRILDDHPAFLSPAAISAFSPHQSTAVEGQ
jgi:hypothetical protein